MRAVIVLLVLAIAPRLMNAAAPFETEDPLKAFVFEQYPRGRDYFISGTDNTVLFRCIADFNRDGLSDVALSERSIWGNRTGPFEIFVQEPNRRFRYQRTADYESELKPVCGSRLESCTSNTYLSSGHCEWKKGLRQDVPPAS